MECRPSSASRHRTYSSRPVESHRPSLTRKPTNSDTVDDLVSSWTTDSFRTEDGTTSTMRSSLCLRVSATDTKGAWYKTRPGSPSLARTLHSQTGTSRHPSLHRSIRVERGPRHKKHLKSGEYLLRTRVTAYSCGSGFRQTH